MNKFTQLFLCIFVSFFFTSFTNAKSVLDQRKQIEDLIKKNIKGSDAFSLIIGTRGDLFERNSHVMLIPASITKLATSLTALEQLTPGTKVQTDVFSSAHIQDENLNGDLYLRGGGDPGFVSESMWKLVNDISRTGLKTVQGDIIVDDSFFDHVRFDESRDDLRVERAYDAPVGALSFNWNSVNIYVRPSHLGDMASVILDPENEFSELENTVKTVSNGTTDIQIQRVEKPDHDVFKVRGQIRLDEGEKVLYRSVSRPDLWSGYQLKAFLRNHGIEVTGKVRAGSVGSAAIPLISAESKPIESMVIDMDKFSNNFVAEMLTKLIGAKVKTPGSIALGMKVISEKLDRIEACKGEHSLVSPSGLTHRNRISTHCLWNILNLTKEKFLIAPEYMSSLPIAGIDGTMKKRLKSDAFIGTVRAKTGSLEGVVSLAGYIRGGNIGEKQNTFTPFAMIYNGKQDESKIRDFFDSILQVVTQPNGKKE